MVSLRNAEILRLRISYYLRSYQHLQVGLKFRGRAGRSYCDGHQRTPFFLCYEGAEAGWWLTPPGSSVLTEISR